MSEIPEAEPKKNVGKRDGKFQPGNPGGPGRPKGALSAGIMALTQEFLSGDDNGRTRAERILDAMYKKATEQGDAQAARLVMDRGYGQAVAHTDLTVSTPAADTTLGKWLKDMGAEPAKQ